MVCDLRLGGGGVTGAGQQSACTVVVAVVCVVGASLAVVCLTVRQWRPGEWQWCLKQHQWREQGNSPRGRSIVDPGGAGRGCQICNSPEQASPLSQLDLHDFGFARAPQCICPFAANADDLISFHCVHAFAYCLDDYDDGVGFDEVPQCNKPEPPENLAQLLSWLCAIA
jgi:hypothetical protein